MIRQLCPHCQKLVELPDAAAGAVADCPLCAKPVAVPAAYAPSVAAGGGLATLPPPAPLPPVDHPPPPGLRPEVLNPPPPPGAEAVPPTPAVPSGYGRVLSLTFSPGWLAWVPVACVTFAFILTLFTWAGTYPGGYRVYSQSPWWAVFGEMATDPGPDEVQKEEAELVKLLAGNRWLLFYLPLLLFVAFLLWVERVVRNPTVANMPGPLAWVPGLWPKRFALLTGLTALLFLLIVMQGLRGFGLETALRDRATSMHAKELEEAAASNSSSQRQKAAVKVGGEFARHSYQTTLPFKLAVLAHAVGFAASLMRWWLHRRGNKPYPRLLAQW